MELFGEFAALSQELRFRSWQGLKSCSKYRRNLDHHTIRLVHILVQIFFVVMVEDTPANPVVTAKSLLLIKSALVGDQIAHDSSALDVLRPIPT